MSAMRARTDPAAGTAPAEGLSRDDRVYLDTLDRCRAAGQLTEDQALDIFLTWVDHGVYVELPAVREPAAPPAAKGA